MRKPVASVQMDQARVLLSDLATMASEVDQSCFFTHGAIFDDGEFNERLSLAGRV